MVKISPKVFFFDFDGVIVDSEKLHMVSALKTSQKYGINFSEDYYFDQLIGFDDVGLFNHLWKSRGKQLSKDELKTLIKNKNHEFLKAIEEHVIFYQGVKDLIERLTEKHIPLAVVSGALRNEIQPLLKKGNLESHFKFIVAADDVNYSKPDPESYEQAYHGMTALIPDLKLEDCWVLEDTPTGIHSAKEAGLNTIGITNSLDASHLKEAHHVISDYSEIVLL